MPTPAASRALRAAILDWYAAEGRQLAFRGTRDPYAILVSEAMAQQTQVARAAALWVRFLGAFPTVEALGGATPAAVLRAWRGLGYNRRALALRAAAIAIVERHGGRVPDDLDALRRLPGVGPYTARAVAALAFDRPVGPVDVNVRRVLSRAVGGRLDAFTPAELQAVADASVPAAEPGRWTHALMDVGATFCRPIDPHCAKCPARAACRYGRGRRPGVSAAGATRVLRPVRPARPVQPVGSVRGGLHPPPGRRRRGSAAPVPFEASRRWLRGRLLDALRDGAEGDWVWLPATLGPHDAPAVEAAIAGLQRDGLAERHAGDARLARLPLA